MLCSMAFRDKTVSCASARCNIAVAIKKPIAYLSSMCKKACSDDSPLDSMSRVNDARKAVLPNEKSHSLITQKLPKHLVNKGSLKR